MKSTTRRTINSVSKNADLVIKKLEDALSTLKKVEGVGEDKRRKEMENLIDRLRQNRSNFY